MGSDPTSDTTLVTGSTLFFMFKHLHLSTSCTNNNQLPNGIMRYTVILLITQLGVRCVSNPNPWNSSVQQSFLLNLVGMRTYHDLHSQWQLSFHFRLAIPGLWSRTTSSLPNICNFMLHSWSYSTCLIGDHFTFWTQWVLGLTPIETMSQQKTVSPIELIHAIWEILMTLSHFAQSTVEVNKPENSAATRSWLTS